MDWRSLTGVLSGRSTLRFLTDGRRRPLAPSRASSSARNGDQSFGAQTGRL